MFLKLYEYLIASVFEVKFLEAGYYNKQYFPEFILYIKIASFWYIANDYA